MHICTCPVKIYIYHFARFNSKTLTLHISKARGRYSQAVKNHLTFWGKSRKEAIYSITSKQQKYQQQA